MDKIDDRAIAAGLDLMFALVLVLAIVAMAILIIPSMSHEDKSWRINQYMAATRASDNLVQDEGQEGWTSYWTTQNYSNVTKIGFVYGPINIPKVLDQTKIDALMARNIDNLSYDVNGSITNGTGLPWWEFPDFTMLPKDRKTEVENVSRALGLDGYNLYMRLYPVGLINDFNYSNVETNLTNRSKVPVNENIASEIDRYIYINTTDPACNAGYLCYKYKTVHYRLNLWVW